MYVYFSDDCLEYITERVVQFDQVRTFTWIGLYQTPQWKDIEQTMNWMIEKNYFDKKHAFDLLDQYNCLRNYVTSTKIAEWKENKIKTDERWVDVFTYLDNKSVPYNKIAQLVAFALCLPGTNAYLEIIFSIVDEIWNDNKSQLLVPTLRAILNVAVNLEYSCTDFYRFLLTQPQILQQIHSSEKYEKQRPQ